jgi:hypothetical protein
VAVLLLALFVGGGVAIGLARVRAAVLLGVIAVVVVAVGAYAVSDMIDDDSRKQLAVLFGGCVAVGVVLGVALRAGLSAHFADGRPSGGGKPSNDELG